jgi:hypothetical protein
MPTDISTDSEINGKRRMKNKIPKRLRHRRQRELTTTDDDTSKQTHESHGNISTI